MGEVNQLLLRGYVHTITIIHIFSSLDTLHLTEPKMTRRIMFLDAKSYIYHKMSRVHKNYKRYVYDLGFCCVNK